MSTSLSYYNPYIQLSKLPAPEASAADKEERTNVETKQKTSMYKLITIDYRDIFSLTTGLHISYYLFRPK
jgi:hypothetical protein